MRDLCLRRSATLVMTVALVGAAASARAESITTMLPNGTRVVIPVEGNGPGGTELPAASKPAASMPATSAPPSEQVVARPAADPPPASRPPGPEAQPDGTAAAATPPARANDLADNTMAAGPTINPLSALPKASFVAFIEKPLFDPTRRLPPPVVPLQEVARVAPPAPPPPAEEPPNLHLVGVIQGERNIAVVRRGDDPKTEMFSTGDQIDGWEVVVPAALGLQLKKGERVVDLKMFAATPPGAQGTDVAQADPEMMAAQARARQMHNDHARPHGRQF